MGGFNIPRESEIYVVVFYFLHPFVVDSQF